MFNDFSITFVQIADSLLMPGRICTYVVSAFIPSSLLTCSTMRDILKKSAILAAFGAYAGLELIKVKVIPILLNRDK